MPVPLSPQPGNVRRAGLLAAISAIALSACASLPPVAPARVAKAPQSYETKASFAAPAAEWPTDRWWAGYGDPQLGQLIDEALAGSPTLAAAEARVRRADAAAAQARARELPSLTGNASAQEMKQSYNLGI